MPQNSVEILPNTCLYNIFETYLSYWGYLLAVNLQIYLKTSSLKCACKQYPKTTGIDYIAKNWALAMMLKALPLVHFWSILLLKVQMMTSVRRTSKTLVWSAQNRSISSEFALKITIKWAGFYRLLFCKVCPENSHKIPVKSTDFSANLSRKILRNLTFFFMTYQKPCLNDNLGFSNSLYNSRTFTNGHLSTTATSPQRPVFLADSPYIVSCFNLSTMATLFCPQDGHWREVQLYSLWYCTVYGDQSWEWKNIYRDKL